MDFDTCPFCHLTVPSLELQRHANNHFEDEDLAMDIELARQIAIAPPSPPHFLVDDDIPSENSVGSSSSMDNAMTKAHGGGSALDVDEKIGSLVRLQIRASFYKIENGLMALLEKCLQLESSNSTSILSGYIDHFQSVESEDVGWGCGWRNIQMISSHLLDQRREAKDVLFGGCGFVPDITSLQRWLEIAWERGFDTLGSNDFDRAIYGKRNWIGTTECAALLRSFGFRARIVDFCGEQSESTCSLDPVSGKRKATPIFGPMDKFVGSTGGANVEKKVMKGNQVLMDWVWNYFSDKKLPKQTGKKERVIISEKTPLYFQHDGHSRTIVGVQVRHQPNGLQQFNLFILDPAQKTEAVERCLKENVGWERLIKRGVHTLRKSQYQLCYVDPGMAVGEEEVNKLKIMDSVRVEF